MSASRATRQRSPPLSRACKLCVRRIVKIPRAHTAIRGIFSVNFHTEGGPPPPPLSSRRPDRSIKFQRWNGNTWTYFTLLKSLPYSAEKPKAGKTAFPCSRLIETLSSNFRKLLRGFCCGAGFFFIFLRERFKRGYFFELVFLTWRNFKHLPRGLYTFNLRINYSTYVKREKILKFILKIESKRTIFILRRFIFVGRSVHVHVLRI